jgi:N-acetyl-gamma-glutamylphosphate reductase
MNIPRPSKIRLVIVGAIGMVGGYVLRYALDHPVIGSVTAIVRRNLGISHPKLSEDPVFRALFPSQVIRADDLARAMVGVVVLGTADGPIFENRDIRTSPFAPSTPGRSRERSSIRC